MTDPDVSANEIDRLVMADPSLAYRLLRYANSAGAGQLQTVNSIHRAILLFGQSELRRAVDLFILSNIAPGAASHLLEQALTRARFCETVAFRLKKGAQCPDYALAGLFSNLDLLLGIPLDCALANLPLEEETLAALLGRQGLMGEVLNLAIAYEAGRWDDVRIGCVSLGLNEAVLPVVHLRAVTGAHNLVAAA